MDEGPGHFGGASGVHLSVVVPAYNEARRLPPTLHSIRDHARTCGYSCEVVVVDDGSRDDTARLAREFDPGPLTVRVFTNDRNGGKGYSIRRGVMEAAGAFVLTSDADLDTPVGEVGRLLAWLADGYDVAVGSRAMPDSVIDPPRPLKRRVASWVFRTVRRAVLLPGIRDTQCGFKCFTRAAARAIFPHQSVDGYAFDCEVLAIADKLGYRTREVGVHWASQDDSHLRVVRDGAKMLKELWEIRGRMKRWEGRNVAREDVRT